MSKLFKQKKVIYTLQNTGPDIPVITVYIQQKYQLKKHFYL